MSDLPRFRSPTERAEPVDSWRTWAIDLLAVWLGMSHRRGELDALTDEELRSKIEDEAGST